MEEIELKVLLEASEIYGLYFYRSYGRSEFVVAYKNDGDRVGDIVESWSCGNYFRTLRDAQSYFDKMTGKGLE